jgi:tripartite-type tricarboxylate transporter receptor subunit TctC
MKKATFALAAGAALVLGTGAATAADYYKGKKVTVFITSGSGGSVDLLGRLGARHLGRNLPGKPTVLAKNKTGAGGLVGANYIYNQAPKDGTEVGSSLNSIPFAPLFYGKKSRATFDPNKFNWIASPVKFVAVSIAWHTSKIKKWQDLRKHTTVVGSSGMGSSSTVDGFVMNNLMGFKYKVIIGYPSGSDIDLAMVRGETEGRVTTAWAGLTSRHPDWLTKNKVTLLYQMGLERYPSVPASVPLIIDHVEDPMKKAALKLKMAAYDIGYPIYAPPGTPADIVAMLRKGYADTYADPKLLAEAKKARVDIAPLTGDQVAKIVADAYAAPQNVQELLRSAIRPPGKLDKAKTVRIAGVIKAVKKKGRLEVSAGAGTAKMRVGKKTKIKIAGKKAKRSALKAGMMCDIDYFGEGGQAKNISCK